MGWALSGGFLALLLIGLPIGVALALASVLGIGLFTDLPLEVAAQRFVAGIRSFSLMAIPLYVLAGALMNASGITQRLVDAAFVFLGRMRGGLAAVTVATVAVFGGISGSQIADTSSVGRLMIPQMIRRGYDPKDAAAVTATAGALFITIPPSITLIVYGVLAETSISDLFLYGLVIGVAFLVVMLLATYVIALIKHQPSEPPMAWRMKGRSLLRATWALLIPVVILGGIRIGAFTPTEGGAVAVFLAVIIGILFHKEMTLKKLFRGLVESSVLVGVIMLVIASAQIYSWALVTASIPQAVAGALLSITSNPLMILLLINVIALLFGAVMEGNAALIVLVPVLLPVALATGIDPVHLGLVLVVNLGLGLITPPIGMCMLVACKIANRDVAVALPAMVPWFIVALLLLCGVTYLPPLMGWV